MIAFNRELTVQFIATVRKYMELRGGLSQKDLAEKINVGVSTISRFLNQKTKDIDEQLVARMVAYLNIPSFEIIEFVQEQDTDKFMKLVKFYKDDQHLAEDGEEGEYEEDEGGAPPMSDPASGATQTIKAKIGKNKRSMSFHPDKNTQVLQEALKDDYTIKDKFQRLSPRQKAYLSDFLDLDAEARDLIVDIGNSLLRYFKQKKMEF
jgi:transcriptional regulator with XRE-family HTH domain